MTVRTLTLYWVYMCTGGLLNMSSRKRKRLEKAKEERERLRAAENARLQDE